MCICAMHMQSHTEYSYVFVYKRYGDKVHVVMECVHE